MKLKKSRKKKKECLLKLKLFRTVFNLDGLKKYCLYYSI